MLLTRISNRQYGGIEQISLATIVQEILSDLSEIYENRSLQVSYQEEGEFILSINEDLACILITNLLKNAFIHTPERGEIKVYIGSGILRIENSGDKPLDLAYISGRFHRAGNTPEESTGLGLSIVQAICEAFRLHLSYAYTYRHLFELKK